MIGLYVSLTILGRFPHIYNYLCDITEENAYFQYLNARMMISFLKTGIVIFFSYIEWTILEVSLNKSQGMEFWCIPLYLVLLFGAMLFLFSG